jgi:glycosyltransferase involved in cell wall biosynthesis
VTAAGTDRPAVAYLTTLYPAVSHSFIQREVLALRARGVEVDTYAIRRGGPGNVLTAEDREALETTFAALPISPVALLAAHARAAIAAPRSYLRALRLALRLPGPRTRALLYLAEAVPIWLRARRRRARHIHAHFTSPSADVALLVATLGDRRGPWRFSFTGHGTDITTDVPARLAEKVRRADTVVCVSDLGRAQLMMLVEEGHWHKLAVVRCGLGLERFQPRPAAQRSDGPLRVLCVGRLAPEKGQQILVDAVAECRDRGVDVAATLVGAGPKLDALRARAAARGVADRVTFTGAIGQDRIGEQYARADVFCLPSFGEGVPVVLMEAMATRVPVVATAVGGIPELVEHGVGGLLVPPGRADRLAGALERLAGDAELRDRLAGAGRARVEEGFDIRRTADRLAGVLLGIDPAADRELAPA